MANFFTQWVGTTLTCLQKSMSVGKKFEELKNYFCGTSWGVQSEHNGWGEKTCSAKKNYFLWQHLWSGITVGGEVLMIWAQRAGGPCLVIIFYHCCLYHCNHNQHNCHCHCLVIIFYHHCLYLCSTTIITPVHCLYHHNYLKTRETMLLQNIWKNQIIWFQRGKS